MRATVEVEEIIACREYKNFKIRVCLDGECETDEQIQDLADKARKAVKEQTRRLMRGLDSKCLAGGRLMQWAYKKKVKKDED